MAGAQPRVTYSEALQAIKLRRRGELAQLQKVVTDNNPVSSLLLGLFFLGLGAAMGLMMPPIGAVAALVGVIGLARGFKLFGVRRRVNQTIEEETIRWTVRDHALEKLGEAGFETLAGAVEAQGSYESVSGWLTRKGITESECNALILAAAVAAEEREALIEARGSKGAKDRVARARAAGYDPKVGQDDPFFDGSVSSEDEGMHARLMREAEGESATAGGDEIARQVAEARRKRGRG